MISVIIPVYNGAEFLEGSLRSIMAQSYPDLEIIVIDDGSTDNSYEICRHMAEEDSRIRLIHQANAGVSAARNHALSVATGEYIAFVDSDDIMTRGAAKALLNAMTDDVDFVIASYREVWRFGSKDVVRKADTYDLEGIKSNIECIGKLLFSPCGRLYKRNVIEKNQIRFDINIPFGEDLLFNLDYCRSAYKTRIIEDVVYEYRKGGIATTVKYYPNRQQIGLSILNGFCRLFDGMDNIPVRFLQKMIRDQLLGCVEHYLGHCRYTEALAKTKNTLIAFEAYLIPDLIDTNFFPERTVQCIFEKDARGLMAQVLKKKWFRIAYKKVKKVYYKFFTRRV